MSTKDKLDKLADLKSGMALIQSDKQAVIDSILTPEIKAKLAEVDAEFDPRMKDIALKITDIETEIKGEVLAIGETVKGAFLMAVWSKGRVSWDTKALDGYATAHPEIAQFRKQGDPSISIRGIA